MDGTHFPNNKLTRETMSKRGGKVEDQYYWPHRVCTRCGHATPPTDKRRGAAGMATQERMTHANPGAVTPTGDPTRPGVGRRWGGRLWLES